MGSEAEFGCFLPTRIIQLYVSEIGYRETFDPVDLFCSQNTSHFIFQYEKFHFSCMSHSKRIESDLKEMEPKLEQNYPSSSSKWKKHMDLMHVNELALLMQDWILHFKEGLCFDVNEKFRHDPPLQDYSACPHVYLRSPINQIIRMFKYFIYLIIWGC